MRRLTVMRLLGGGDGNPRHTEPVIAVAALVNGSIASASRDNTVMYDDAVGCSRCGLSQTCVASMSGAGCPSHDLRDTASRAPLTLLPLSCAITLWAPCACLGSVWDRATTAFSGPFKMARVLRATDFDATSIAVLPTYQSSVVRSVIAVGYADNVVRLWLTTTGELLGTLEAHTQPIFSLTMMKVCLLRTVPSEVEQLAWHWGARLV